MAARLDLLDESIRDAAKELVRQCGLAGLMPRVTSTLRSNAEQTRLYRNYLTGQAGYPVAPPGLSAHEYGLAFDMVLSPMDALADVGAVWIDWGGGWNPADAIHFEALGASESIGQGKQQKRMEQLPTLVRVGDTVLSFLPTVGWVMLGADLAAEVPFLKSIPTVQFWKEPIAYSWNTAQDFLDWLKK